MKNDNIKLRSIVVFKRNGIIYRGYVKCIMYGLKDGKSVRVNFIFSDNDIKNMVFNIDFMYVLMKDLALEKNIDSEVELFNYCMRNKLGKLFKYTM